MASKAHLNQIATVAVANGIADMLIDNYGMCMTQDMYLVAESVREVAQDAMHAMGISTIAEKDVRRIKRIVSVFQGHVTDDNCDITSILSLSLAILEDTINETRNKTKRYVMENVLSVLFNLFNAFDCPFEPLMSFENAVFLSGKWQDALEAA